MVFNVFYERETLWRRLLECFQNKQAGILRNDKDAVAISDVTDDNIYGSSRGVSCIDDVTSLTEQHALTLY